MNYCPPSPLVTDEGQNTKTHVCQSKHGQRQGEVSLVPIFKMAVQELDTIS